MEGAEGQRGPLLFLPPNDDSVSEVNLGEATNRLPLFIVAASCLPWKMSPLGVLQPGIRQRVVGSGLQTRHFFRNQEETWV